MSDVHSGNQKSSKTTSPKHDFSSAFLHCVVSSHDHEDIDAVSMFQKKIVEAFLGKLESPRKAKLMIRGKTPSIC